jgi:hypothetical protein
MNTRVSPNFQRLLLLGLALLILLGGSLESRATHLRSATISWKVLQSNPVRVEFKIVVAVRRNFYSPDLDVGDFFDEGIFDFGDGVTLSPTHFKVVELRALDGLVIGEARTIADGPIEKTYGANSEYTAFWTSSDRISELNNRANGNFFIQSKVAADRIRAQAIFGSPIIAMNPIEFVCGGFYDVQATGGQGATLLRYRISTDWDAVAGNAPMIRTDSAVTGSPPGADFLNAFRNRLALPPSLDTEKYWTIQIWVDAMSDQTTVLSSSAADFILKLGPPVPPRDIVITPGSGKNTISWTHSISTDNYRVEQTQQLDGNGIPTGFQLVGNTPNPTIDHNGTTPGIIYYYKVVAHNPCGESQSIAPQPPTPGAPTGLTAVPGNTTVTLSWNAAFGFVNAYSLERSLNTTPLDWQVVAVVGANTLSHTDTGLANGTSYIYRVRARNSSFDYGPYSNTATATPLAPPPVPTGVTEVDQIGYVSLTWNPINIQGVTFNVSRSTGSSGPFVRLNTIPVRNNGYADNTAEIGVTYYYVVSSQIQNSESANSSPAVDGVALPPVPDVPSGLAAMAGNNKVTLTWNIAANATSYKVKRSASANGPFNTLQTVASTMFIDTTAANGTKYYYVVSAVNANWESANSAAVSTTPYPPLTVSSPSWSAGTFQFNFIGGPANEVMTVASSQNLTDWTTDITTPASMRTLTGQTKTYTDSAAGTSQRFYRVRTLAEYGNIAVGFYTVTIPGRASANGPGGHALIAPNQLDRGSSLVSVLLAGLPANTVVSKMNSAGTYTDNTFNGTSWSVPGMVVEPWEAVFVRNPGTTPLDITFAGTLREGAVAHAAPAGYSLLASALPQASDLATIQYSPDDGDTASIWDEAAQGWGQGLGFYAGWGWFDNVLHRDYGDYPVGHGFVLSRAGASQKNWTRAFSVWSQKLVAAQFLSSSEFKMLLFGGKPDVTLNVEWSADLQTWTALPAVTLTGGITPVTDPSVAGVSARFYRASSILGRSHTAVGFYKVTVPGRQPDLSDGYALVAPRQLDRGANFTYSHVSSIFAGVPAGTSIQKMSSGGFLTDNFFNGTSWTYPSMIIGTNEAVFVRAPDTSDLTLTFLGTVREGQNPTWVGPSYSLTTSLIPKSFDMFSLAYSGSDDDQLWHWNESTQDYANGLFFISGAWYDDALNQSDGFFPLGRGLLLQRSTTGTKSWKEPFSAWANW